MKTRLRPVMRTSWITLAYILFTGKRCRVNQCRAGRPAEQKHIHVTRSRIKNRTSKHPPGPNIPRPVPRMCCLKWSCCRWRHALPWRLSGCRPPPAACTCSCRSARRCGWRLGTPQVSPEPPPAGGGETLVLTLGFNLYQSIHRDWFI